MIKVHFKIIIRGSDQDIAIIDRIWQISDTNKSQLINKDSGRIILTSGTPLKLEKGYELSIKSIDINGDKAYIELSKNGNVVDYAIISPPKTTEDTYIYSTDIGSNENVELINVHFINLFRGPDQDIATIDRIWQISDTIPINLS